MKKFLFVVFIYIPCLTQAQTTYDYNCEDKYRDRIAAADAAKDKCTYAKLNLEMAECMTSPSSPTDAESKKKIAEASSKLRIQIARECNGTMATNGTKATDNTMGKFQSGSTLSTPVNQAAILRFQIGDMINSQSAQIAAKTNQDLDRLSNDLNNLKKDNMEGLSKDEYEFMNGQDVRGDLKNDIFNDPNLSKDMSNSVFYKNKLENLNKSSFAATNALFVKPNNSLVGEFDLTSTKSLIKDAVNSPISTLPLKQFILGLLPSGISIPTAFASHLITNLNSVTNIGNGLINELNDAFSEGANPEQNLTNMKEVITNNLPYVGSLFRFVNRFL